MHRSNLRRLDRWWGVWICGWACMLAGCGGDADSAAPAFVPAPTNLAQGDNDPHELRPGIPEQDSPAQVQADPHPEVIMTTSLGEIRLRLNAEQSPRTVDNFLAAYVDRRAYDNTIVHYVEPGFMVAMGGFGQDYQPIEARTPIFNEADNEQRNTRGTVAMARMPDYVHSATSQFFINLADNPDLNYQENEDGEINGYCVFGEVVSGMEIVDQMAQSGVTDKENFPRTPTPSIIVTSIRRAESP